MQYHNELLPLIEVFGPFATAPGVESDATRPRLGENPREIEKKTEAIRARFADPQPRMFPVAVTFLVPAKLAREGR